MAFSVEMPALGESVTEGTVTRWLKQEGDTVEVDEPLLEVSTDKVDTEIPSPAAGVLQKIVAQEDDTVEVGGELAVIGDADDSGSDDSGSGSDDSSAGGSDDAGSDSADEGTSSSAEGDAEPAETVTADAEPAGDSGSGSGSGSGEGSGGTTVEMPALGESVTEGTVTRWLKSVGDTVEVDEPLLEVSTDKVDTEIPSPVAGTLLSIAAEEDETVEVGGALATIGDPSSGGSSAPADDSSRGTAAAEPADADTADNTDTPLAQEEKQDVAAREEAASTTAPRSEPAPEKTPAAAPEKKAEPAPATATAAADDAAGKHRGGDDAPYVTPLVRKLAAENDVDLSTVTGSGVGGRIRKQDVLAAAEAAKPAAAPEPEAPAASAPAAPAAKAPAGAPQPSPELAALRGTVKKASRIRQITATKTRESLQTTAQLTQVHEVDMTRVVALRARAKKGFAEREGVNLTYLPFFAKAVVEALKAHPNVNASYDEASKEITYHAAEHLGIAVDTERGLLSPVIHNAGDLSIGGLARAIADIADKARTNKLTPEQLSGGTFTITNIGSQGALIDTPILVPPQSAMLGTGAIVKRPVVVTDELGGDTIAIRSVVYLPMTYDHRLVDGADAGRFLSTVKRRLEEAAFEADLGL